jgi:hypothetical protein
MSLAEEMLRHPPVTDVIIKTASTPERPGPCTPTPTSRASRTCGRAPSATPTAPGMAAYSIPAASKDDPGFGRRTSEQNAFPDEPMESLQLWILPDTASLPPQNQQRQFTRADRTNQLLRVIGPEVGDGERRPAYGVGGEERFR